MLQSTSPECIVRHAFFDEAGLSREPYTIVAGIMIHVDKQYRNLQRYILDLADDLVGKDRPMDFYFHAKELWHGNGFFPKDKWSREKRMVILAHLADIPAKYEFPIIYACVERAKYPPKNPENRKSRAAADKYCHTLCFLSCLSQTNRFMKDFHSDEMAFAVVEDHADHRAILRDGINVLGNPRLAPIIEADPDVSWEPLTHLIEDALFQKKSGTSPLQIADVCAFILNRHFAGISDIAPFVERIEPRLATGLHTRFVGWKKDKGAAPAPQPKPRGDKQNG